MVVPSGKRRSGGGQRTLDAGEEGCPLPLALLPPPPEAFLVDLAILLPASEAAATLSLTSAAIPDAPEALLLST